MKAKNLIQLWIVYTLLILAGGTYILLNGFKVNTDFLSIFPKFVERGEFYAANAAYESHFENELLLFVSASNTDLAIQGAVALSEKMNGNNLFGEVKIKGSSQNMEDLGAFLYLKRKALLTSQQIEKIQSGKSESFVDQAVARLYSPTGTAAQIKTDPLGLFQDYYLGASGHFAIRPLRGYLISEAGEKSAVFIQATMNKEANDFNARLISFYETEKKELNSKGLELNVVGGSLFSAFGSEKSMDEVGLYGVLSLVAVLVLLLFSFSSVIPIVASALTILISVLSGFVGVMLIYKSVHILSILLGISVLGIVTDYCTHFFAKGFDESLTSSVEVIEKIKRALGIGFLTNMLTYLCFYFSDLLVLKQLSIFTMLGILTTYLTVIAVFPILKFRKIKPKYLLHAIAWTKIWNKISPLRAILVVSALVISGLILSGGFKFNDDVKLLQTIDPELKSDETKVFSYLGVDKSPYYFILKGSSAEEVLKKEEDLSQRLSEKNFRTTSLSKFVPSEEKQKSSLAAYSRLKPATHEFYKKVKIPDSKSLESGIFDSDPDVFTVDDFLSRTQSLPVSKNWLGSMQGSYYSVMNVFGAADYQDLDGFQDSSIHLVSKVHDLSLFLTALREAIIGKFLLVFLVLFLVLVFIYNFKKALFILFAPTMSALSTLIVVLLLYGYLNLFNVLAIILIFCLGMDYSVFFSQKEESKVATHIGVFISFISTISSFGVLAMSSTYAVSSFGLSVFVGICLCYFLSPLSAGGQDV